MKNLYLDRSETPIGPFLIAVSEFGVVAIIQERKRSEHLERLRRDFDLQRSLPPPGPASQHMRAILRALSRYSAGKRETFESVTLDLRGTPFQLQAWRALRKVDYGETISYGSLAQRLGTKGARAIGNACGRNPVPIVVPCHRVIASDGRIGGFGLGLDHKRSLLKLEGVQLLERVDELLTSDSHYEKSIRFSYSLGSTSRSEHS
ncbi:MAG: methylated-DNA--[protein]-cysteine S-methyltransferase [Deltaproteobacteria bacterium]|nr:methylated-DNA--[protein]-cysteine S-methyltransferase [Deltaproteobacteria bacterium]